MIAAKTGLQSLKNEPHTVSSVADGSNRGSRGERRMSYGASAYAKVSQTALSPREAEAAVLIKAASRLQAVQADWENQKGGLPEALNFNQKVWTIIAGAATAPESPLPEPIKTSIAQLSVFVFRRMIDTLIEPSAEKLSALISINHNIAAGLRT
ncbi:MULTISPECIES: flagellar biosynthesis regulator FlaF [unclassified Methylobacterium]|jgi:flagellar protein FlaF|uniref:flagellar biosynthesis regulator FlaF n=1 Tax=unclassified Methylobacterium TaxID=2615210 RepID=UPI001FCD32AE|nr:MULTISPECIES: flagellar biosynthesis regulator FlaF [unclassified Methylobacterium]